MIAAVKPAGQRGMTLVELMIAMVLGILLTAAVVQVYIGNRRNHDLQENLTGRQETARYAAQVIQADAQMAGFRGCLRDVGNLVNTLNTPNDFLNNYRQHVTGFEANGAAWAPALPASLTAVTPAAGSDVLTLRIADDLGAFLAVNMPTSSSTLTTRANMVPQPFVAGDIGVVADCGGTAVFQVTAFTPATGVIGHNTGAGTPGNATTNLARRYVAGAQLFSVRTTSYFIDASTNGSGPALWRRVGSQAAQELAEGVENLQVLYGEDDDGDQSPDVYRRANNVLNWANIVSVQVGLLAVGPPQRVTDADPRVFQVLDRQFGPYNDGRLRRVVTFTVALRNRLT